MCSLVSSVTVSALHLRALPQVPLSLMQNGVFTFHTTSGLHRSAHCALTPQSMIAFCPFPVYPLSCFVRHQFLKILLTGFYLTAWNYLNVFQCNIGILPLELELPWDPGISASCRQRRRSSHRSPTRAPHQCWLRFLQYCCRPSIYLDFFLHVSYFFFELVGLRFPHF